jgi:DNA primase large subunit
MMIGTGYRRLISSFEHRTMINYSFYPILEGAARDIDQLDEQTILYARDNIEKYKPTKLEDIDITVWLVSTIILHNLKNNFLIRKFVTNYGKLMESKLLSDIKDKEVRKAVLYYLNVFKDLRTVADKNRISLHMTDYLEIALVVSDKYPHFKLVNCDVDGGHVHMDIPRFVYLVRLVVEHKLFEKIKGMKDYHENEIINRCVNELGGIYPESVKRVSGSRTEIPLTIQQLIDKIYEEHHLRHSERIKLGLYLLSNNFDWEYIIEIFSNLSDFSLKTTTYQLNSLRKYIKS